MCSINNFNPQKGVFLYPQLGLFINISAIGEGERGENQRERER